MGYHSVLSKFIHGVPCQLRLNWDEPDPCSTWVSFDTQEIFTEEDDTLTGMVYPLEMWRLKFIANLTRPVSLGVVRWFGDQLRDTTTLNVVAYVHVMSPRMLQFLPPLPASMLRPYHQPCNVADELAEADRTWEVVHEAVFSMRRQAALISNNKFIIV